MLVGCVVVDDGVDRLSRRYLRLDGVEEADELLVAVALHVAADDGAVEDVEGGEQRGRAVAFVVVGHRSSTARLHRQAGLGAIKGLDLALLIDREDDGMGGRVDIEADDVAQLVDKLRVGGELELLHPVRLKTVRTPDALDGTRADIDDLRHHGRGPVGRLGGRLGLGERHDTLSDGRSQRLDARGPCLVAQKAVVTFLHEAFLPAPDTGLRFAGLAHDLIGADTVRTQQDDLSSPDMLVWGVAIPRERLQTAAISGLENDGNSGAHAPDSHAATPGNPRRDSNVRRNPLGDLDVAFAFDATFGRSARSALFLGRRVISDDQKSDNHEPGGETNSGRQHLPAMAPGPINAGSTAGADQRGVKFS